MSEGIEGRLQGALADRYRIVRELGRGGMATVFLADDLKHNRQVAIKVLSPELAAVVGKERFFAEIETTAQLQHPNILPLFDSGEADGLLYYAMPYVEGESLADRLARERQLPVDEALDLTRKLAAALAYAHERGVVHRDIKPANVLLSSGEPLLADFGIALAVTQAGDGRITETGLSLGTPHYMSPEQASGDRSLDPRSDVYALGCVLYEMLLGEPPFPGPSPQAVLARILTSAAARVTASRPTVPVHVDAVVARALEKLPADRFHSAAEMRRALDDPSFRHLVALPDTGAHAVAAGGPPASGGSRRLVGPALAGLTAVALLLAAWAWFRPAPDAPVQRFRLDITTGPANGPEIDISPDGTRVVYRGRDGQLYLRPLTSLESQPIPGTLGGRGPFFSPDGRSIGFNAGRPDRIYTLPLSGGTAVPVGDPADVNVAAAWGEDGFVYYQQDGRAEQGIVRAPAQGGGTDPVLSGFRYHRPAPLPGVTDKLLVISGGIGAGVLEVGSGVFRPIPELRGVTDVRAAGPYVFYRTLDGLLAAARFDADAERLTSPGVTLARDVGEEAFTVSSSGTLVYQLGLTAGQWDGLFTIDSEGIRDMPNREMAEALGNLDDVRISPDGRRLALTVYRSATSSTPDDAQVFVYDTEAESWQQLTFEGTDNFGPRWLPDGRVAFLSEQSGELAIWAKPSDRSAQEELLFAPPAGKGLYQFDPSPVPGGPMVVMMDADDPSHEPDLFLVDPVPGAQARPFVTSRSLEVDPAVSPDGRWVLYRSDETGIDQVYVRAFPGGGPPYPVVLEDAVSAAWGPGGTIVYGLDDRGLVRADLDFTDGVRVTGRTPIPRTETLSLQTVGATSYDVTSDGRVLAIGPGPEAAEVGAEAAPGARFPVVVLNVFREIEERLAETGGGG